MGVMVHQHHHRPSNQLQLFFLHGVSVTSLGGMVHQHCHRPQLLLEQAWNVVLMITNQHPVRSLSWRLWACLVAMDTTHYSDQQMYTILY